MLGTREITFRAWDCEQKKMIEHAESGNVKLRKRGNVTYYAEFDSLIINDRFIVMQYTGIKDSNAKEIYEGDIVKTFEVHEYGEIWDTRFHIVVWGGEDYPAFTLKPGLGTEENIFSYLKLAASYNERFEIVGNIFETPELIDKCT